MRPKVSAPGGLAVGRARDLALRDLQVAELRQAAAADDRQQAASPFSARIAGRLRQKPFASMPQPKTKRSGIVQADEIGRDRLFRSSVSSRRAPRSRTTSRRARAAALRIAAMVSPSSRMSSSTSTVRSAHVGRGGETRQSIRAPRVARAVARGVDVVEVEREAQQRQQLAGEHHRAAHHREHQRDRRRRGARSISAATRRTAACDFLRAGDRRPSSRGRPRPVCRSGMPASLSRDFR